MRRSVLVVDDDTHIQSLLTHILSQAGFEVRSCRDGHTAIDELVTRPYDLAILDLGLPNFSGIKVLQTIRGDGRIKDIPVIILTSSRDQGDIDKAIKLGVTDYLLKPPKKQDLLARMERVLGGRPQFEQIMFNKKDEGVSGSFSTEVYLQSISKKGMMLKGDISVPSGTPLNDLRIPLLHSLGVSQNSFTVAECLKDGDDYQYIVSFLDLNQPDRQKIYEWIITESFKRKSSGRRVS
ncbi:MAG: response regulator [Bdellovibrionales bacterium]